MIKIGPYDDCSCGSEKKFKFCCKNEIIKPNKLVGWVTYPEKFMVGSVLKSDAFFKDFYNKERDKITYPLYWAEDNTLAEGINFRVTTYYNAKKEIQYAVIRMRQLPPQSHHDAMMIAHEMIHLLLDLEGFEGVAPTSPKYDYLASALSSMLEDPVVNSRLQKYGFDILDEYDSEVKDSIKQLSNLDEPKDYPERLHWIINFAGKLLDKEMSLNKSTEFEDWFTKKYPSIASEGKKVYDIVKNIGYGSAAQKKESLKEILSVYDKRNQYFKVF